MRNLSALLAGACVCIGILSSSEVRAASPDFTAGVTAYGAKNFKEAVRLFGQVVRSEPRNTQAVYYLANSYYSLGQQTAALNYFRFLADNYPATSEGRSASSILSRLNAQSAARGEATKAVAAVQSETPRFAGGGVSVDEMIVVVKNLADHPAVTTSCISGIKSSLNGVPKNVLAFLHSKGCKVYITPTMIDKEPGLLNTQPRGYEQGKTYKNVPACFDGRNVVVCNYAMRGTDEWEPCDDPGGSTKHEIGHALDQYMGNITDESDFKLVYYKDCGKVDPEMKEKLAYFVQKAEGGPSECFAECVATIFGGRPHNQGRADDIRQAFPNVIKYIQTKLAGL